jgi:hypothetical protein
MRPPLLPGLRKSLDEAATVAQSKQSLDEAATAYVETTRGPDARHRGTATLFYGQEPLGGSLLLAAHVTIQFQSIAEQVWDGDAIAKGIS